MHMPMPSRHNKGIAQSQHNKSQQDPVHNKRDVIQSAMASKITDDSIVYSNVCSGADQRNYQSSASLAFVRVIHR